MESPSLKFPPGQILHKRHAHSVCVCVCVFPLRICVCLPFPKEQHKKNSNIDNDDGLMDQNGCAVCPGECQTHCHCSLCPVAVAVSCCKGGWQNVASAPYPSTRRTPTRHGSKFVYFLALFVCLDVFRILSGSFNLQLVSVSLGVCVCGSVSLQGISSVCRGFET